MLAITVTQLKDLWFEYYPIVVGFITVAGGVVAVAVTVWIKIQPYLEKISLMKDKITDTSAEDVTSKLQATTLSTQITDLKSKIENPAISAELKQEYIKQLESLIDIKAKIDAGLAKADEVTNKYT